MFGLIQPFALCFIGTQTGRFCGFSGLFREENLSFMGHLAEQD